MTREPGDRPERVILPACGARAWGGSFAAVTCLKMSCGWRGRHGRACENDSSKERMRHRIARPSGPDRLDYGVLIFANLAAWVWAFVEFSHQPVLIGTAVLAYSVGLRHAIEADHIEG